MKRKKYITIGFCSALTVATGIAIGAFKITLNDIGTHGELENALIISSNNQVINNQIKTVQGSTIWAGASGITWNNGNNKMVFDSSAFFQNRTTIHGIKTITVNLVSGSLHLMHGYNEVCDLDLPFYGYDYTFTSTSTFTFTDKLPMYIRLQADQNTVVESIKIDFDCATTSSDDNEEDPTTYLENYYLDWGNIGSYANARYVTGSDNVASEDSKRALALSFKNTASNELSISPEASKEKKIIDNLPDFRNKSLSFKAKFSSDVENHEIEVKAMGKGWKAHSGYIQCERSSGHINGWYTYTVNFADYQFEGNDEVIRLYIKPMGINNGNKNTATVLLDEIYYPTVTKTLSLEQELLSNGLENMTRDTGWENTTVNFNRNMVSNRTSSASLEIVPGKKSKDDNNKWFISLAPEFVNEKTLSLNEIQFSKGLLTFDYKPINVKNPDTFILAFFKDWSTAYRYTVANGVKQPNGWYRFTYDLANSGLAEGEMPIRVNIGFDVEDSNVSKAKMYIDNMHILPSADETIENGLENMARDTGWEKCNVARDYSRRPSTNSIYSYRLTFNGKISDANKNFICLSPQNQGLTYPLNKGVIEAKFAFSEGFATKKIRVKLVDSGWKWIYYDVPVKSMGNGWYIVSVDLATATPTETETGFDSSLNMIRMGFGFCDLTSENKDDKTVWIDEVRFTNNKESSTISGIDVWQAYNTETILQSNYVSDRTVTSVKPLVFEDLRNASDATQLMLSPEDSDITSFDFKPDYLVNSDGDYIAPDQFEVSVAKYIEITTESIEKNKTGWQGVGMYPDALVPIKSIIAKGENYVSQGNSQSIYIACNIAKDQTPGMYVGNGILTINGTQYKVPMQVTVHNATLDDQKTNKSCYLLWEDQIEIGEGFIDATLRKTYYNFALNKGIASGSLSTFGKIGEPEQLAENFANSIANDPRITTYRLPYSKDENKRLVESTFSTMLSTLIDKNIAVWENGDHVNFFDKIIFYVDDEPKTPDGSSAQSSDKNAASKADWAMVKDNLTTINKVKNDLKSKLDNYPELKESFVNIRNVLPMDVAYDHINGSEYHYGFLDLGTDNYPNYFNSDYLDTPCPAFHHLTDATVRAKYAETFKHTWFYGCLLPQLPYPGYHIDNHLINERLIQWMQYDYNFEGNVYWGTNFYQEATNEGYIDRDVWTRPFSAGSCAGDGQLSYPGKKYDIYGPITSLRYETTRNAYKDYEYFILFDKCLQNNKNNAVNYTSCREFLATAYTQMFNGTAVQTSFTSNLFENIRQNLLNELDILY